MISEEKPVKLSDDSFKNSCGKNAICERNFGNIEMQLCPFVKKRRMKPMSRENLYIYFADNFSPTSTSLMGEITLGSTDPL